MKFLLVVVALAAAVTAELPITNNYHEQIGIPEAQRIWRAESAMDFDGSRIIGGSNTGLGQYPYMAGLVITLTTWQTSVCGSTLVSNTKLVTAAHCWKSGNLQASQFTVVLGSLTLFSGGTRITTNQVEPHGSYNQMFLTNDVAVITINHVSFSNNINKVALASGSNNYAGSTVTAIGFGLKSDGGSISNSQTLSHVSMTVITNAVCQNTYGPLIVVSSTLCTNTSGGTKSTCNGDSGGPLTVVSGGQHVLVGITSFGSSSGCQSGAPAGFARVTSFATWFNQRI